MVRKLNTGQTPPQAVELEEVILGALMLEKDAYDKVEGILEPNCFYKPAHQHIFSSIQDMHKRQSPIDILTVTQDLKARNKLEICGGPFYVGSLTSKVANAAHLNHHAKIVAQKFLQRELIRISSEMNHDAFDETIDVDDMISEGEKKLANLRDGLIVGETAKVFKKCLGESYDEYVVKHSNYKQGLTSGVPTGFPGLDNILGGWQKSDLIIIGGRPSMGKTAVALFCARIAAMAGCPTAFFSLEMSSTQLTNRVVTSYGVNPERLRDGNLFDWEFEKYNECIKDLYEIPLYIDDKAGANIPYINRVCRKLHKKGQLQLIIIDYIQLITNNGRGKSREQEVSEISRAMKILAKDLNVPVILLSQLSRKLEERPASMRVPLLSDLRESGAIEQDADVVLFPFRPSVYGIEEDTDGNIISANEGKIYIKKHRNGKLGDVAFKSNDTMSDFFSIGDEIPVFTQPIADPNRGIESNLREFDSDQSPEMP